MDTFASEKGLLKYIKANGDIFNIFISNMHDDLKHPFEWTIKNNDLK